jgi:hypothetical protein
MKSLLDAGFFHEATALTHVPPGSLFFIWLILSRGAAVNWPDGFIIDIGHQGLVTCLVGFEPRAIGLLAGLEVQPNRRVVRALDDDSQEVSLARVVDENGKTAVLIIHAHRVASGIR